METRQRLTRRDHVVPAKTTESASLAARLRPAELPVTELPGVGRHIALKLARLGIRTVQDLLFHLPSRYQDRTKVTPIGAGRAGQQVVVVARIEHTAVSFGRRRSLLCRFSDGTGAMTMRLFYFTAAQKNQLRQGRWVKCFGELRRGATTLEMVHPEYRVTDEEPKIDGAEGLTPIYPSTDGLGQGKLRRLTGEVLNRHLGRVVELLPGSVLHELDYPTLQEALQKIHRPPVDTDTERLYAGTHPFQQRLAFEEMLAYHLSLRIARQRRRSHLAPAMSEDRGLLQVFLRCLGFDPTHAQRRVIDEILADLRRPEPMLRLVQGDVGSGKTVVAGAAIAWAIDNGSQVAVMAPTELLAEQHYKTIAGWFAPLGVQVDWLTGRVPSGQRSALMDKLESGRAQVVVGTHALFQGVVRFQNLGLAVVDEQHRFGVGQRLALRDKGKTAARMPHQLVMTATPIPRTLAMTFYADLDVSSVDQLPPGRQPVETVVLPETRRAEVVARVHAACTQGRQAYWVCPIIDESEALEVQAATETEADLARSLPDLRVGLAHGRMKAQDKEVVMQCFRNGEVDLLVATTVIEVGVDVPNASLMVIDNAERLGLAQLHQLRGRVGRGSEQACCVLLYKPPLGLDARTRLAVLRDTTDGFEISRKDLELRGPGELMGTRQAGLTRLMVADLIRDRTLLPQVERVGRELLAHQPETASALVSRWVGRGEDYANV